MPVKTGMLDWAIKAATLSGQSVSGDRAVVKGLGDGVLVAVIDGLGHGPAAALAAERAALTIEDNAGQDLAAMMQLCHSELTGNRGAVISLVKLGNDRTLTWLGVGNVTIKLLRGRLNSLLRTIERPVLKAGLVGHGSLPLLRTASIPVRNNDLLFLATDGIELGFAEQINISAGSIEIAEQIIDNYVKHTDDALVFVGRYVV
jgi:negative regulator of sigma-B (phosphoserine phosphatase)